MFKRPKKRTSRSRTGRKSSRKLRRFLKINSDRIKHLIIISAAIVFVIIPIVIFGFFLEKKSSEFACGEGTTPSQKLIIVLDKSERITATQKQLFNKLVLPFEANSEAELVKKIRSEIPVGTQIVIYPIDGGSAASVQPIFDECRKPLKEDFEWYDHFYKGAMISDMDFYNKFFSKIKLSLRKNLKGGGRQSTPILETLDAIIDAEKKGDYPIDLIVFSDLKQNSKAFSFYKLCTFEPFIYSSRPICPPIPAKQPCSVAIECNKIIENCTTSLCLENEICGPPPECGKPVSFCAGTMVYGSNPYPQCSCIYAEKIGLFKKQCGDQMSKCSVKAVDNLEQCQTRRRTAIDECKEEQKSTREQCREEEVSYRTQIANQQKQCEDDLSNWRLTQEAKKKEYERKMCTWDAETSFDSYKQTYKDHWRRIGLKPNTFRNITFIQLRNRKSGSRIPLNWIEGFWDGFAKDLKAEDIKFYRQ
jgi:hypothetical protein